MLLTKQAKEEIKMGLVIAYGISPEYFNKKIKALHEMKKALFDLSHVDYKKLDNELNDIIIQAFEELQKKEEKTA